MKRVFAALTAVFCLCAAAQTTNVAERPYVKPCMVQVGPTVWMNLNDMSAIGSSPDGSKLLVSFGEKTYEVLIPADQAANFVRRALSTFEACRR